MLKKIKVTDIRVGMYVDLGSSWLHHSFLKPKFKIVSADQINRIIKDGLKIVTVDTEKSEQNSGRDLLEDLGIAKAEYTGDRGGTEIEAAESFDPMDQISEILRETIEDSNLAPKVKARAVYTHSVEMMANLLDKPSAENILKGKTMIYGTVDHILANDDTASALTQITSHDYYTYTHSVNVGMLSILLSKAVFANTDMHDMQELGAGFFLHDLGKCNVPPQLINKPDKLSPQEWEMMRNHPSIGQKLLEDTNQLSQECGLIVMQHHEREDGAGYPYGLKKDDIHLYGRICSIADVYDALTSTRAYKKKLPPFEALRIMKEEMLQHFNKSLFGEFVQIFT